MWLAFYRIKSPRTDSKTCLLKAIKRQKLFCTVDGESRRNYNNEKASQALFEDCYFSKNLDNTKLSFYSMMNDREPLLTTYRYP